MMCRVKSRFISLPVYTPVINSMILRMNEFPDLAIDWKAICYPVMSVPSKNLRCFVLTQSNSALRERSLLSRRSFI